MSLVDQACLELLGSVILPSQPLHRRGPLVLALVNIII